MTNDAFVRTVSGLIPLPAGDGTSIIVGVDGVDGAGKTTLADSLAAQLVSQVPVIRVSLDGFHNTRATRYRRGKTSAEGFWLDSYDYDAFRESVVEPFRSGVGTYLPAAHDLETDERLTDPRLPVMPGSLVLVDGIFLHRPELRAIWDFTPFSRRPDR